MIAAPGAEALAAPFPKSMKASRMPRPGPGLASSRNRIDWPVACDCARPSGVRTPWLIALLRNRILAGSMSTEVSGSRPLFTSTCTPAPIAVLTPVTTGLRAKKPATARMAPQMPAEKLSTSISKPGLILPSHRASIFFIVQPPSGPMIMAPMNIGIEVPAMTPIVAIAPTTPPRGPRSL